MKITAALAWWNEPPDALARLVESLAGFADRLVALDGRWVGVPGATDNSSEAEVESLRATATHVGIDLHLSADGPRAARWTQVEKRDILMRRAAIGSDWIVVVDGDEHIERSDREAVEKALAGTTRDVATVTVRRVGAAVRHQKLFERRRLYRASAGVKVELAHNGYLARDGRWLNGDPGQVRLAPALDLSKHITIAHDLDSRPKLRRHAAELYYRNRVILGEEWAAV